MANVRAILERTPPPILYHYTTQQGLLGIITNKEIWATHTQYLNDVREFRHALELVKQELSAMQRDASWDEPARKCLADMQESLLPGIERINVCVCSFSEHGDVLSQWRAYGSSSSGFAIGFSGTLLRKIVKEYGWLVPVLYDEHDQRLLVRTLLEDVLQENIRCSAEDGGDSQGGNLLAYIYRYAPILKHKSFEEESEWRLITHPLSCTHKLFGYRAGASMLAPYFRLPLGNQESLGIQEIIVGPTPYPEPSLRSVDGLLLKNGINTSIGFQPIVTIRASQVPYRNW